jgi:hypothetical protein
VRRFPTICLALALVGAATPAVAQTGDQSRLVVGLSVGWVGGTDLWSVDAQPITAIGQQQDLFALQRRLRSNIAVAGQVTYFPRAHLGLTGDIGYLGLGTEDRCQLPNSTGDFTNEAACTAANGLRRSASAVGVLGGITFRPLSRSVLQPYARVLAGVVLAPRSTVELAPVFGELENTVLRIYRSEESAEAKPAGALALGVATSPNSGSQFRVELRGTWVRLSQVDGPSAREDLVPPNSASFVMVPSLTVGFDIVLEKRRGRRY